MQQPSGVGLVGANRRLLLLLGLYAFGLFGLMAFVSGSPAVMLMVVCFLEVLLVLWRPTPKLGPSSYSTPEPPGWRELGEIGRWYELWQSCTGVAVGFVVISIIFGAVMFSTRWHFGAANWITLGVFGVWLVSRPFWSRRLVEALGKSLPSEFKPYLSVIPTSEGYDISFPSRGLAWPTPLPGPWVFHVAYGELEEIRTMSALDAYAYWDSVRQYDAALDARAGWEYMRYTQGQLARPSIITQQSAGTFLLMRGPTLLYLFAAPDAQIPAVMASWQAHRQPSAVSS